MPLPSTALFRWTIETRTPPNWWERLQRAAGGFFHSPAGLRAGAPDGAPLYATLWRGGQAVGVAAGVRTRCRLSYDARHAYFPTAPALVEPAWRDAALAALADALRDGGIAEARFDSFDAPAWSGEGRGPERLEYVLALTPERSGAMPDCSTHHRRHIRRGEREHWSLGTLHGAAAAAALEDVMGLAGRRAARRGSGFDPLVPAIAADRALDAPWGATTFVARDGLALLAAALVGWSNGRAFYVSGGATEAGYAVGASAWLHWRIQQCLITEGFVTYNLGGAPATAVRPDDPSHGLHRFKTGFGADVVACAGDRWALGPAHLERHRMLRRAAELWR